MACRPFIATLLAAFCGSAALADAPALQGATGEDLLRAAYATCLAHGGTGNEAGLAFAAAGWQGESDDETGWSEFAGPEDSFALTWTDGGFCLVQSERLGSAQAALLVSELVARSGAAFRDQTGEDGCRDFFVEASGLMISVTSSGNDPTCTSPATSGVSFSWEPAADTDADQAAAPVDNEFTSKGS